MNVLFFLPAFVLGFPLVIGIWIAGLHMFRFLKRQTSDKAAFVVSLCSMAAVLSLLTAPVWLMGWKGYALVSVVYVIFVGIGAPHVYRTLRFLGLELDGNPQDQVDLPGDEPHNKKSFS